MKKITLLDVTMKVMETQIRNYKNGKITETKYKQAMIKVKQATELLLKGGEKID